VFGGAGTVSAGGAGAVGTTRGANGGAGSSSGGGGGGVGYIRIFSTTLMDGGGRFSPPAT
ncbi:MAG TPA: hypothetical protein VLB44_20735, partial [Kofleriaceae bacterium]|nr:hypothetical protein [Kofleriaceae bacterium]